MDSNMLADHRASKDGYLRTNPGSPIPQELRGSFAGLPYFAWNPDLILTLAVSPGDGTEIQVATSDGADRIYRRVGSVDFDLGGAAQTLHLYDTGHTSLFLPFRDATSGKETYGAGRYLDIEPNDDGTVTLDFNLAYSPFCAYSDGYSCALPPADNWMSVPIEAGEKTWQEPT